MNESEKHYNAGVDFQGLWRLQEAIQDYDEAIRLNPQYARAYTNRARTYAGLGKYTEAKRDVDQAVELGFDRSELDSDIEGLKRER